MISLREMKEKNYIPPRLLLLMMVKGGISLAKVLLFNFRTLKKTRYKATYIRPERRYELPEYKPWMKCYAKDEKYLRETLYVKPCAKEIVALANELGAGEKDDYEFARDAFEFVKRKLFLEFIQLDDAVATLKRGSGTCLHMLNLYVALCRAAGIKARYKLYALSMIDAWYNALVAVDPLMKKWYDAMGFFTLHGEAEVFIDGKWYPADAAPTPERQAAAGIPITKFGESSIGMWTYALPGSIIRLESLPYGIGGSLKALLKIAPGTVATINNSILRQIEEGRRIIEEAGGEKAYDEMVRRKRKKPVVELKEKEGLIFKYDEN